MIYQNRKLHLALILATVVTLSFSKSAVAQDDTQLLSQSALAQDEPQWFSDSVLAVEEPEHPPAQASPGEAPAPEKAAADDKDGFHFAITPYLWFAGIHGTAGVLGHDAGVHVSFTDLAKHLDIGLMLAAEPRYKRFSAPVDFMWMKLSADKASPLEVGPTSASVKIIVSLLTPKAAYRVVDGRAFKVDGTFGIRYFHVGTNLSFQPEGILPTLDKGVNWVDAVAGAKIQVAPSPKMLVTVLGDAGAGGANVDYQVAGLLGYRLCHNMVLQAGWRYLDVNYRPPSTSVFDLTLSGVLVGLTIPLK